MLITFHINREVRLTLTHLIDTDGKLSNTLHISVHHLYQWLKSLLPFVSFAHFVVRILLLSKIQTFPDRNAHAFHYGKSNPIFPLCLAPL